MNDDNIYYFAVRWILYISKQQQDFVRILYTDFSTKYFWKTNFTLVCVFFSTVMNSIRMYPKSDCDVNCGNL